MAGLVWQLHTKECVNKTFGAQRQHAHMSSSSKSDHRRPTALWDSVSPGNPCRIQEAIHLTGKFSGKTTGFLDSGYPRFVLCSRAHFFIARRTLDIHSLHIL